jgi:hypothetical protein
MNIIDLDTLQRIEANHTYEVELKLGNLQPHQLQVIAKMLLTLEDNGVKIITYNIEND